MTDTSHLNALEFGLSNERVRLANAKTDGERAMRAVWVAQYEKQIAREIEFLGLAPTAEIEAMTDDELLAALAE